MSPIVTQGAFWYMLIFGLAGVVLWMLLTWLGCRRLALWFSMGMLLFCIGVDVALTIGLIADLVTNDGKAEINTYFVLFAVATHAWAVPFILELPDRRSQSITF